MAFQAIIHYTKNYGTDIPVKMVKHYEKIQGAHNQAH